MSTLHGSLIVNQQQIHLFIWGEVWRSTQKIKNDEHPNNLNQEELISLLATHKINLEKILGKEVNIATKWTKKYSLIPSKKKPRSKSFLPILAEDMEQKKLR